MRMNPEARSPAYHCARSARWLVALVLLCLVGAPASAQTFNSGSTGADGAYDLTDTPPGTTVLFDPVALGIDPERDNVFHFTTISIPSGVTVRLSEKKLIGPVFWLATGPVVVSGTINLNGEKGHPATASPASRNPADPGAGGFTGGLGRIPCTPPTPGNGPGGGPGTNVNNGSTSGGNFTGNEFLVPLFGGSGGGGGCTGDPFTWAAGGGAGGGAILIASSASIQVNGAISANGGQGGVGHPNCRSWWGGAGSGGAIRLVAPVLRGSGSVSAAGGTRDTGSCETFTAGGHGRVRLEAFRHEQSFSIGGIQSRGSPVSAFIPPHGPSTVRVVSVAGVPVPPDPTGSFELPDVTINSGTAVPVEIAAQFVPVDPPGKATVHLHLFSLEGADQVVPVDAPLVGTFESSITTATVTFPPGFTRGFVRAVWR